MNDAEFLAAFENCSLSFEQWTHRAHISSCLFLRI